MRCENGTPVGEGRHDLAAAKPLDRPDGTAGPGLGSVAARNRERVSAARPASAASPVIDQTNSTNPRSVSAAGRVTGREAALAAVAELAARPRRPVTEPTKPFDPQDLRRRWAAAVRCTPLDCGRRDPLGRATDAARAVA